MSDIISRIWRRGNASAEKVKGHWLESGHDMFFSVTGVKKSLSDFCLSAFFEGLIVAAPILFKVLAGFNHLKKHSVFSGFAQVIELQ